MSTCSTCRFWGSAGREVFDEHAAGFDDWRPSAQHMCARIIHGNETAKAKDDVPAMVCDGSGYAATFWTLPTFGCSLWEAKP